MPPLLEERQAQTHAREAGCCDAAAVAGTDDDGIVDRHRLADCLCCKHHETFDPAHSPIATSSSRRRGCPPVQENLANNLLHKRRLPPRLRAARGGLTGSIEYDVEPVRVTSSRCSMGVAPGSRMSAALTARYPTPSSRQARAQAALPRLASRLSPICGLPIARDLARDAAAALVGRGVNYLQLFG